MPSLLLQGTRLVLLAGALCAGAFAQTAAPRHASHGGGNAACTTPALACAAAVGATFDHRGRLWLAWTAGGALSVARSDDGGARFGEPVVLGRYGALLDGGADARPQIVVDARGRVVVAWGVFKDKAWNAQVLVSVSTDDGATFSRPRPISDHPASQRFPALALDPQGELVAAWLDKRTVAAARQGGTPRPGAALAVARSRDGGASFAGERIALDGTCECCRLGLAFDARGHTLVLLRALYEGGERDHALVALGEEGAPPRSTRVAEDHWAIEGCPHHGPSLAVSAAGTVHAAWFTQGSAGQGTFVARSTDGGARFGPPQPVGNPAAQPGRPWLLADGGTLWLAWKEFDGRHISVRQQVSHDDGLSWSAPRLVAETADAADHPVLLRGPKGVVLSWMTRAEGYRLLPLEDR